MKIDISEIVNRAATIDELLSENFETESCSKAQEQLAQNRLQAWCRSATGGDWVLFQRKLEREGYSISFVLGRFANSRCKLETLPPQWALDTQWILKSLSVRYDTTRTTPGDNDPLLPFVDLFSKVIDDALDKSWSQLHKKVSELFLEGAISALKNILAKQLSDLCAPVLFDMYINYQRSASGVGVDRHNSVIKAGGNKLYKKFISYMQEAGLGILFTEKPVLLRLIATFVRQWINTTRELAERYLSDCKELSESLLPINSRIRIRNINGPLSDPHNFGRSVVILETESNIKIVYKPKDCRIDKAWEELVDHYNSTVGTLKLRAAKVIARNGYGWQEYIEYEDCVADCDAENFFQRAGMTLALFHMLIGADLHYENLIASGAFPIPIDLEMILQPTESRSTECIADYAANEIAADITTNSVLSVGLLPAFAKLPSSEIAGMGGLNQTQGSHKQDRVKWYHVNTDKMTYRVEADKTSKVTSLPRLDGKLLCVSDYSEQLIYGFRVCCLEIKDLVSAYGVNIIIDKFRGLRVRRVLRPTRYYSAILDRLRNFKTMSDGVIWSSAADFGSRFSDWHADDDTFRFVISSERLALINLNIPAFYCDTDGQFIYDNNELMLKTAYQSGIKSAVSRIADISIENIEWQCNVIRASVSVDEFDDASDHMFSSEEKLSTGDENIFCDLFMSEASRIYELIEKLAIRKEKSAAWIGLDWFGDSNVSQVAPLGFDLYGGSLGVSLFLAAYGRVANNSQSTSLSIDGTAALRKKIWEHNAQTFVRRVGTGGATGLGSFVYGLSVLADLTGNDIFVRDAKCAAGLFTSELVDSDKSLDVVAGNAGAILGLLRLYRQCQEEWILEKALQCGAALLKHPRVGEPGRRSWISKAGAHAPLNGLSHGAAGFAYAFSVLSAATGRREYMDAAIDCITYENHAFDYISMNWPDFRSGILSNYVYKSCQWCHGAIGIGLARIGSSFYGGLDREVMRTDVLKALRGAELSSPRNVHHICCGEFGRVDFLNEVSRKCDMPDAILGARRLSYAMVTEARLHGGYKLGGGAQCFNISLFKGLGGIGYTLLRLIDNNVPSVLLFE